MDTQQKALLEEFSQSAVYFPSFAKAYSSAQNAIEMSLITKTPNAAIICGPSGTGKTTLCDHLIAHYHRSYADETPEGAFLSTTTVYFEVPEPVTIRQLVEDMLHRLNVTECKGGVAHLTFMLIERLNTMNVNVVFLDEIQRLCVPSADKIRLTALGWIVSFCNYLKKPVMLAGTEECRHITQYSAPFANRYPHMIVLNFFTYDRSPDSAYHRTLEKLDQAIVGLWSIQSIIHLHDADIAASLFVATSGNLKWLRIIIYCALAHCLARESLHGLERVDFIYACDQVNSELNLHIGNPFTLSLSQSHDLIQRSTAKLAEYWVPE
ncbi:hypothetical protein PS718_00540 [Pseudomonas fluorescens]|uniref:AAA+ ATPase domain-containing protein n=1 Tax=Pseudomonas fluorescens TaxID=294 RepID=A0A5E7A2C9_PSEFL|nr:ATP-binding protein [Pseudomonas fluorescens]VVN72950.1 hypothetical protein PS718_00540 [Pseudomonas fluorescens]